ncbi:uncharacterized protein METZ01_LOCUS254782, partial [marine metagenome]
RGPSGPDRRRRSAQGGSTPTSSGASSGLRPSGGTPSWTRGRGHRPVIPGWYVARARSTAPRTATSWSSASTS